MMVAEQSDWGADGRGHEVDCRSGGPHGAWLGCMRGYPEENMGSRGNERVFNTTTIGVPLGTRTCRYVADYTASAYWGDYVNNMDNRDPIVSAHPGCAQALLGDGSVHTYSETIEFTLFQRLAIRDSGLVKEQAD